MGAAVTGGGFLDRWSRRKREAAAEPEEAAPEPATVAEPEADPAPEAVELPPDLPPLDSLTPDSPLAPFLQKGVPAALKNAALRRMWLLDPAIRDHVDFAVDYAWDWNVPGGVPGHGGALAPGSVARFLDRLKGKAEPPTDGKADPPTADAPPPVEPQPVEPPLVDAPTATAEPTAPQPPAALPRPRRHGGAAPA